MNGYFSELLNHGSGGNGIHCHPCVVPSLENRVSLSIVLMITVARDCGPVSWGILPPRFLAPLSKIP